MGQLKLNEIPVGRVAKLGKMKIKVASTINGCHGCFFQKDGGARICEFTSFCFAHNRLDNKSVIFQEVTK